MKKFIFDILTAGFSIFENPFHNYIAMAIIGSLAFAIAWNAVDELGFRGELGSIFHWGIRIIAFVIIWFVFGLIIKLFLFVTENWIYVLCCFSLIVILIILKSIADDKPDCILNKKIF